MAHRDKAVVDRGPVAVGGMRFATEMLGSARSVPLVDLLGLLGLILVVFALIAKNLSIDNAVVFHDEYLYRVWADATLDHAWMLQHGVTSPMPNRLFAWVYRPATRAGLNAYDFAQLLNVGFWAIGCAATWALARRLGVSGWRLLAFVLALVALPLSSYTKYFMPEAMYTGLFLVFAGLLIDGVTREAVIRIGAAGALVAAMYFVKPHALFAVGIAVAYLLVFPSRWSNVGTFLAAFVVAFLILNACLPNLAPPGPHGLGLYEDMLRSLSNRLAGYESGPSGLLSDLAHVAAPHVAMMALLFGVPMVVALGQALPWARLLDSSIAPQSDQRTLSLFVLVFTASMLGVAVVFTVLAGEIGRIHTRYYMFMFPLLVVQLALVGGVRLSAAGSIVASLAVVGGAIWVLFVGPSYAPYLSISHVSDGPEWGLLFARQVWFRGAVGALVLSGLWMAWRANGSQLSLLAVAAASLLATGETAVQQKSAFRNGATDGRDTVAVEQLIGQSALSRLVVVGPDAGDVDKFLFFMRGVSYVDFRPDTNLVSDIEERFPDAEWLVTITTRYAVSSNYNCRVVGAVRLCHLPRRGGAGAATQPL